MHPVLAQVEAFALFLCQQAHTRINESVAPKLELPREKLRNNIQRYGHCSAASIPLLLAEAEAEGALARGQLISMTAFGSGFSWASALVRW